MAVPESKSNSLREVLTTSGTESYWHRYAAFFSKSQTAGGDDFGQRVPNVPPPSVMFPTPLRWYSWDRPRRLAMIRALRDQVLQDILALRKHHQSQVLPSLSEIRKPSVSPLAASQSDRVPTLERGAA